MKRPMCWLAVSFLFVISFFVMGRSWKEAVSRIEDTEVFIKGSISQKAYKESVYGGYWQLTLKNVFYSPVGDESWRPLEGKYLCRMKEEGDYYLGQQVCLSGSYSPWEEISNPGQFDMGKWYCSQGILGQFNRCRIKAASREYSPFQEGMWQFRQWALDSLCEELGDKDGSLIAAMILGEKSSLDPDSKNLYQRNGISHILAISGLHLMLLGMGLFKLMQKCLPSSNLAAVCCSIIMSVYCIFTGGSVSAVRATIMFVLTLIAGVMRRSYDSLSALAVAAILQLFMNPYVMENSGFLLSFLAVVGVTFVAPGLQELFQAKRKITKSLLVSAGASLTTLSILLSDYGVYPWHGVFLNLLIIPPMSLLLGISVLYILFTVLIAASGAGAAVILNCLIFIKDGCGFFIRCILRYYEICCRIFEKAPFQDGYLGSPSAIQIVLYYLILFLIIRFAKTSAKTSFRESRFFQCIPFKSFRREIKTLSYIPLEPFFKKLFLLAAITILTLRIYPECEITMLDVGQGDCVVIRSQSGNVYLSDGGSSSISKVGTYRIIPFLKYRGYDKIKGIFLSHLDEDHINGIVELMKAASMEKIKIDYLILPVSVLQLQEQEDKLETLEKLAQQNEITMVYMKKSEVIRDGSVSFTCLYPEDGRRAAYSSNDGSLVLDFGYGEFHLLFTGDLEETGEEKIVEAMKKQTKYQVLKVAHHGSASSTTDEFLQMTNPRVSLISYGRNSYGHPDSQVVARLKESGSLVFETGKNGAITIYPKKDGSFRVESYKGQ